MKDYANKPKPPAKSFKKLTLVAIFIISAALVPFALFYFKIPVHFKLPALRKTAQTETHFDFYTLLPNMEVNVSDEELKHSKNNPLWQKGTFMLQLASLRQQSQAIRFRNDLSEAGYTAFIEEIQQENITWYRVLIGPYDNLSSAERDQQKLQEQHRSCTLLKLKLNQTT